MKHQYKLGNAKINFETTILTWNHDGDTEENGLK